MFSTYSVFSELPDFKLEKSLLVDRVSFLEGNNSPLDDESIKSALYSWHQDIPNNTCKFESIEKLSSKGALCSVTGQQTGFALSPLLSVYKFISNEIIAKKLSLVLNKEVLPVFWLQTEDHDLKEIASAVVLDTNLSVSTFNVYDNESLLSNNRKPIASVPIPEDSYVQFSTFLKEKLSETSFSDLENIFDITFKDEYSFPKSFAKCLSALFPDSKTVFIDPGLACFDQARGNFFSIYFKNWKEINKDIETKTQELQANGSSTPITLKKDSPLFFYHPEERSGNRYRFEYSNDRYHIPEVNLYDLTENEIFSLLKDKPSCFSTSALIRPVFQDTILPCISYIGGPSEVAYLRQTSPLYNRMDIPQTHVFPRAMVSIVDEKLIKQTESVLSDKKLFFSKKPSCVLEHVQKTLLSNELSSSDILKTIQPLLDQVFQHISRPALDTDQTLERPLQKTIESTHANIKKFLEKYDSSLGRKDEVLTARISKITALTHPGDIPQERHLSPFWLIARYGLDAFIEIYKKIEQEYDSRL